MVNRTHLSELKRLSGQERGYKDWNQWRRENLTVTPDFSNADLSGLDLGLFDLRGANLRSTVLRSTRLFSAELNNADLSNANLSRANLSLAQLVNCLFDQANLSRADLRGSNLRKARLIAANLREANLSNATLNSANLTQASLSKADLTSASMKAVNLQDADLSAAQALGTDFEEAVLTGVCLQDWNFNNKTILENVRCEYVFLERGFGGKFSHRLPNGRPFSPREFIKQFQRGSNAIELFLPNGIADLPLSLQSLRQLYPDKVFEVQEIELKERKVVLVRLEEALPAESQESVENFYYRQVRLAKASYEQQATTFNLHRQLTLEQFGMNNKLTQGERQRLEGQRDSLQSSWDRRRKKWSQLLQDLAIESGSAIKFQLQQQIKEEEEEMKSLHNKLAEIEQTLACQDCFPY